MRLRHIPGCEDFIRNSKSCLYGEEIGLFAQKVKERFLHPGQPLHIEIGMGKGQFIRDMAALHPEMNYLGIEKFESVLMKAIQRKDQLEKENGCYENLLFACMDAKDLAEFFHPQEIDRIYLNFSDPWPKKRHAPRRLTSIEFLKIYRQILHPEGTLEFKTDNAELFTFSLESAALADWQLIYSSFDFHREAEAAQNVMTEYEKKFSERGQKICKLIIKPPEALRKL